MTHGLPYLYRKIAGKLKTFVGLLECYDDPGANRIGRKLLEVVKIIETEIKVRE